MNHKILGRRQYPRSTPNRPDTAALCRSQILNLHVVLCPIFSDRRTIRARQEILLANLDMTLDHRVLVMEGLGEKVLLAHNFSQFVKAMFLEVHGLF